MSTPELTAAASTRTASVQLVAIDPSATEDKDGTLTRTDVNGTRAVRRVTGQTMDNGPMVVTDYEAAIWGTITYTLTGADGQVVTATTTLAGAPDWIAPVQLPQYGTSVPAVIDIELPSESQSQVHWIIDREDPLYVPGPLQTATGHWTAVCGSFRDALAVRAAYSHGPIQLRTAEPGADQYAIPATVTIQREADAQSGTVFWLVNAECTTVPCPPGPILGALNWTLDRVAAMYPTLDALAMAYASLTELEVGPWRK